MLWKPPSNDATESTTTTTDNAVDTVSSTEEFDESHLHGSAICLSVVSERGGESEDCFYPSERTFHVEGLAPGQTYTIKFTLFERNQAIAAIVRSVRVAGIHAVPYVHEIMTINSALQVAAQYALRGMENAAEDIYRSILAEMPLNPQALHNIGAMYYNKGDSVKATEFVERAMQHRGNDSLTGYHNTLGICYKTLGRLDEAERQFRIAIDIDPAMTGAKYNLGLLLQAQKRWTEAIELYQVVLQANEGEHKIDNLPEEYLLDSMIRSCDLLQAQQRYDDAIKCWQQGLQRYPQHYLFYEELGGLLAQLRMYDTARYYMEKALDLGHLPAEEKLAQILEAMGAYQEAKLALENCIERAQGEHQQQQQQQQHQQHQQRPLFSHLRIRNVTMLPKVIPNREEIRQLRHDQLTWLEALLLDETLDIDNASPHNLGFGLGFEYLYHDEGSNMAWKSYLQQLYRRYCPALSQGHFLIHPEQREAMGEGDRDRDGDGATATAGEMEMMMVAGDVGADDASAWTPPLTVAESRTSTEASNATDGGQMGAKDASSTTIATASSQEMDDVHWTDDAVLREGDAIPTPAQVRQRRHDCRRRILAAARAANGQVLPPSVAMINESALLSQQQHHRDSDGNGDNLCHP
eukprot:gene3387-2507_t